MKKILFAILFISTSVFANGELEVSFQEIHSQVIPMNATGIPILQINLTAQEETIFIDKLIFSRTGLSSAQDVKSIRATGPNIRSRSFPMMYDDTATINFFGKLIIPAKTTQSLTITANLDIQGVGRTIGLNLVEIISSATQTNFDKSNFSPPTTEEIAKSSSITNQIIEIEELNFTPSRLRLERWQKLGRFRLKNLDEKSVALDAIYLQHDGVGSLPNIFHNLILTSQHSVISKMATLSNRSAYFPFLDKTTIRANSDRLLEVWGKVKRNKSTYSIDFRAQNDDISFE